MKLQKIVSRYNPEQILFSFEAETLKEAVVKAVAEKKDLSGAYISGADLSGTDLSDAVLSGADLSGAYISGADLSGADLSGADLSGADLRGAYLRGADLRGADLRGADLSGAYISGAYISGADLRGADLRGAYISGADLSGADLSGAILKNGEKITSAKRPFISITNLGNDSRELRAFMTDKGIRLETGCFFGDVAEFKAALKEKHGKNIHAKEYTFALKLIETHFKLWAKE
jgi:hypothetical protein